jgi:predicted nucleic acid-binding protein
LSFYFLESSALAKLFVQERGTDRLIALVEPLASAQKLVSCLALLDVYAAIRKRERAGGITAADAAAVLEKLNAEFSQMTEQPVSAAVTDTAKQLLDRYGVRPVDALQLASCCLARTMSGVTDYIFVSTNAMLLDAAKAEGLQVLNPENEEQD